MLDSLVRDVPSAALRFRWVVLAAFAVGWVACAAAVGLIGLDIDNSPEVFEREGHDAAAVLRDLQARFGRDDAFAIVVQGDVVDPVFLAKLGVLDTQLAEAPLPVGADPPHVVSVTSATFPVMFGASAAILPLIDLELEPEYLRDELVDNPFVGGRLVGGEGDWAALWVRTDPLTREQSAQAHAQLASVLDQVREPGFQPILGGIPALEVRLDQLTVSDMGRAFAIASVLMTVVLVLLFRHPVGIAGPLLVVNGSIVAVLAVMAATGITVNYLNSIVPTFLVAVGVGDAVHVQSAYRQFRTEGLGQAAAIEAAYARTGRALIFTSVTTMAGLLAFRTAHIRPIVELGTLAAVGVFAALVLSFTVLPAFLTLAGESTLGASAKDGPIDRLVGALGAFADRRRRLVLGTGLAAAVGSVALSATVDVAHDPLAWFPPDLPTKQAQVLLDEHFAGAAQFDLLVTVDSGSLTDPDKLAALAALETRVAAYRDAEGKPLVGQALSFTNFMRQAPTQAELLSDPHEIAFAVQLMRDRWPESARLLLSEDGTAAHVLFPLTWLPATEYGALTEHLDGAVAEARAAGLSVRPTGLIYSLLSTMGVLVPDLLRSFGFAFAVITLMMVLLLRDWRLGLVAMIPNLLPIAMAGGLMGLLGIPLDASTLLVFSIALGLCVDDTIHLLQHVQQAHAELGDVDAAISRARSETGRAIVITSLIIVAAIAPTLLSTLYSLVWFGGIVAWTVLCALLADLVLTPVVLRWAMR